LTRKLAFLNERLPAILFIFGVALAVFSYGYVVGKFKVFPYWQIEPAYLQLRELFQESEEAEGVLFQRVSEQREPIRRLDKAFDGLTLVTRVTGNGELRAEIIDMTGRVQHVWNIDWFEIWPEMSHAPDRKPIERPGTHIHGAIVLPNGDLVFNFEHLGLVRLDRSGHPVWKLPYQTHHSIHLHDDGNLWVSGQRWRTAPDARFPNRNPPFDEYTLLIVSQDGDILREWSVADLLIANDRTALLHMGSLNNTDTTLHGWADSLHLNDVEPFPSDMEPGFFGPGDVLVSLRNINTVFVFNVADNRIKFLLTGPFVRQHDPDFVDGNHFSVFDNQNIGALAANPQSRILLIHAPSARVEVVYEGTPQQPFFTDIMGKHQWLPNGNLLITEARRGRAFEVNPEGVIVWEHINYVGDKVVGLMEEAQRLFAKTESEDK